MLLCLDCAAPLPPERCQAADLEIAGVRCALEAVSEAALFCDGRCRQQYFGRRSGTALRAQARARNTTLNEEFRRWLEEYTRRQQQADQAMAVVEELRGMLRTGGRKFTREEMNER